MPALVLAIATVASPVVMSTYPSGFIASSKESLEFFNARCATGDSRRASVIRKRPVAVGAVAGFGPRARRAPGGRGGAGGGGGGPPVGLGGGGGMGGGGGGGVGARGGGAARGAARG